MTEQPDGGSVLGRALTPGEAALAAATPIYSLPLAQTLLMAFAKKGFGSVADLVNAPMSAASLGPVRARRVRQAILSVLVGEFSPAVLGGASLTALPAVIDDLLGRLANRRQTLIRGKHGLWDGHRLDHYRLAQQTGTDHRTVQKEIAGASAELRHLLRVDSAEFRAAIRSLYRLILAGKHGMAGVHEWEDSSSLLFEGQIEPCLGFAFLCRVGDLLPERFVTVGLDGVCHDSLLTKQRHDEVMDAMKTALVNSERAVTFEEMCGWLERIETSPGFIKRCLEVSRELGFEKSGMIGLRSWAHFDAHSLRDMIHAALSALREPAHFERIAQEIERLYSWRAPVNVSSVHHTLAVHKDEFVLARHGGVYGLSEWPVRAAGSLKDFLVDYLRTHGGRAKRRELLAAAMEKGYKSASVSSILNMNKDLFRRCGWGQWELAV